MANTAISALRDEVLFRVTPDPASDTSPNTRIVARLNWALRDIAELKQPDELEATEDTLLASGTTAYDHPSDLLITKSLTVFDDSVGGTGSPFRLRPINAKRFDLFGQSSGQSSMYLDYNGAYHIAPTPETGIDGRVLRVRYTKIPATVTDAAGQLSPLDRRWDEIVVLGAMAKYLRDNNEFERAQAADRDYGRALGIRRSKKATNFAMAGGKGLGLGRSGRGGGVATGGWR